MFLGALALAFLIGGAIALPLAKRFGQGHVLLVAALISGGGLVLLANSTTLTTALLCLGLNGICAGTAISLVVALLQHESEPALRGRLMSIYTVTSQVIPAAGGLGAGLLLEVMPANHGLLVVGSILSLLFVLAIWRLRLLRGYV
jgi:MFS family permease